VRGLGLGLTLAKKEIQDLFGQGLNVLLGLCWLNYFIQERLICFFTPFKQY
jgi:hypothetical protein